MIRLEIQFLYFSVLDIEEKKVINRWGKRLQEAFVNGKMFKGIFTVDLMEKTFDKDLEKAKKVMKDCKVARAIKAFKELEL